MKKSIIIVLFLLCGCALKSDSDVDSQKIENLKAFAKVYGYVKYFHPSDEASEINWKKFATYGALSVKECSTEGELVNELICLFRPIAPSIQFSIGRETKYDVTQITPKNLKGYKPTFWQHLGVGFEMIADYRSPYSSVRVNSRIESKLPKDYGQLNNSLYASLYKGKKLRFKAWATLKDSLDSDAYIRMALVNSDGKTSLKTNPVQLNKWLPYEIVVKADSSLAIIEVGAAIKGKGSLMIDEVELSYWDENNWKTIPLKDPGFEKKGISPLQEEYEWFFRGDGYNIHTTNKNIFKGNTSAQLTQHSPHTLLYEKSIFETAPKFGEYINERIGGSVFCQNPIVLYSNHNGTFPKSNSIDFKNLQNALESVSNKVSDSEVRLGNVINTYNVFQHFYPYMEVVDVDWNKELENAIQQSLIDKTPSDHHSTLEKFTSPLQDGHMNVGFLRITKTYAPGIAWEWVENKLVITEVSNKKLPLNIGDIVTHINGETARQYFSEVHSRISAATKGSLELKAKTRSLMGEYEEKLTIKVNEKDIILNRLGLAFDHEPTPSIYEKINDEIFYLNIGRIEMDTITKLLPELSKTKSIICDLRGYPNRNHLFLSHLLKEHDTSSSWLRIPKAIYPNREKKVGFKKNGWYLKSAKPYLGNKQIFFLTDARAISYAESYLSFIEGYNLATIIGQATAGTNGNINTFELEDGFNITWTGTQVLKHDGSQHHGVGITPDIYVSKTIEGIKAGRDEFLEKALELIEE